MKSICQNLFVATLVLPLLISSGMAQDDPAVATAANGGKVYVTIAQSPDLVGSLVDMENVKMTTDFGDVAIPFSLLEGIKMDVDANDGAVVAFKNGDVLTGKISLEKIMLKTNWGQAQLDAKNIETITVDKNGRFYQDRTSGGWNFSKAVETRAQPATRRTPPVNQTIPRQFGQ